MLANKVQWERNCKHQAGWREEQQEHLLKSVDRKFTRSQEKREYDGKNSIEYFLYVYRKKFRAIYKEKREGA